MFLVILLIQTLQGMAKKWQSVIFSDSICASINMNKFNCLISKTKVIRKTYLGATPKKLLHYVVRPLIDEKPDICIINIGTNKIRKEDSFTIAKDIVDIVNLYAMNISVYQE